MVRRMKVCGYCGKIASSHSKLARHIRKSHMTLRRDGMSPMVTK